MFSSRNLAVLKTKTGTVVRALKTAQYAEKKRKNPCNLALEYYDLTYAKYFGTLWPSIRIALLSPKKYCALINDFGSDEATVEKLEHLGCLHLDKVYTETQESALGAPCYLTDTSTVKPRKSISVNFQDNVDSSVDDFESRLIDPKTEGLLGSLHDFMPATKFKGLEDSLEEDLSQYEHDDHPAVQVMPEANFCFPKFLKVMSYPKGISYLFKDPQKGILGLCDHYPMDGGSLLAVLALGLTRGDKVLDCCAAPGGKSLAILQTLLPSLLLINDESISRLNRVKRLFDDYLGASDLVCEMEFQHNDARNLNFHSHFDKVLVDVPCTRDRYSVNDPDNNIFSNRRIRERLEMPKLQKDILVSAMKYLKPGGAIVYSTCSMSVMENDGVVKNALQEIWENSHLDFVVKDLSAAFEPLRGSFHFADRSLVKYGQLVLPNLMNNFGPTYICKLERRK